MCFQSSLSRPLTLGSRVLGSKSTAGASTTAAGFGGGAGAAFTFAAVLVPVPATLAATPVAPVTVPGEGFLGLVEETGVFVLSSTAGLTAGLSIEAVEEAAAVSAVAGVSTGAAELTTATGADGGAGAEAAACGGAGLVRARIAYQPPAARATTITPANTRRIGPEPKLVCGETLGLGTGKGWVARTG